MKTVITISVVLAASLSWFTGDVAAASTACASRTTSSTRGAQPGEQVVEGTIAWTNREASTVVLDNGTELIIPPSLDVMHTKLLPRRPVKAYYVKRDGRNVATVLELRGVHPGEVG